MSESRSAESARLHLSQAVTRSSDGFERDVCKHLAAAERRLQADGRDDLAARTRTVVDAGPTTAEARYQMRQVMQLLDAELSRDVTTGAFRAASDGGERL